MRDQFLHQSEVQHIVGTATDILHKLGAHKTELHLWTLQDIIDLLSKGYTRQQIIAGFTTPVFAD